MNARGAQLGLSGTHYANPIGLDDPGNYSTARDLAALAARLMRNPRFARIVDMPRAVLESGSHRRVVRNRNDLVGRYEFVDGIKTGHTIAAGDVLVGAAHRDDARVISVVLGEPSEAARDTDTLALLRYGLSLFRRVRVLATDRVVARPRVKHRDERVALVPRIALSVTVAKGERIERRVDAPDELDGPIAAGEKVGTVAVLRAGRVVRRVDLLTAHDVPGAGALRVIFSVLGVPLTLLILLAIVIAAVAARRRIRLRLVRDEGPTRAR
jgi:D-alanyl-D-alanine carboxypeptidase (penicillin-binding protein 5/6)